MADTYTVVITPRAEASLENIIDYLIEKASFETAQYVNKKLLSAIDSLKDMPTRNAPAKEIISKAKITYLRALSMSYRECTMNCVVQNCWFFNLLRISKLKPPCPCASAAMTHLGEHSPPTHTQMPPLVVRVIHVKRGVSFVKKALC